MLPISELEVGPMIHLRSLTKCGDEKRLVNAHEFGHKSYTPENIKPPLEKSPRLLEASEVTPIQRP